MNIKEALNFGAKQLKKTAQKNSSPLLDASILLCEAIKKPKEFIYSYPEKKLSSSQEKKYKNHILRRAKHEPLAYIINKKEFYGFEFLVNKSVLIPRPETETLISAVLPTIGFPTSNSKTTIVDVGTGSGAIAITLKKLLPKAQVFASDISQKSLALAKKNANRLGAKITFKKGSLFSPFRPRLSDFRLPIVITANLPYLSQAEWREAQPEVKKYEPKGALIGGKTGTEIYEKLFKEIACLFYPSDARKAYPNPDSRIRPFKANGNNAAMHLFIEIGYNQKAPIMKLLNKILHPKKIETFKDLGKKWRTIHAVLI
ncbi:MAG: peptide chain release factor N(5)-glutamine methyltransferase [Patescibacteria group bacterium]